MEASDKIQPAFIENTIEKDDIIRTGLQELIIALSLKRKCGKEYKFIMNLLKRIMQIVILDKSNK